MIRHSAILTLAGLCLTLAACNKVTTVKVSTPPYGPDPATAYSERREERVLVTFKQEDPASRGVSPRAEQETQVEPAASDWSLKRPVQTASAPASLALFGELPNQTAGTSSPLDGNDNLRRVSFATEGADFDPAVDPTGSFLVYASTRHRQTADLYLSRIGGTSVTQLTSDAGNDAMPAISPDGKRIAFCSDRAGNWDIYVMDTSGGQAVQITSDPAHELHPSFSPDGRHLVYSAYGAQSGQWELVVIDLAQPATRQFIGFGLFPNWSPKDNRIVYQRARERGTKWFSVWTIEYEAGQALRPTEVAASSNAACITPDWSPDGRHIVFCTVVNPPEVAQGKPAQADVWVVAADGSGRVNLTSNAFANLQPVWAGDGSIYFVSNRSEGGVDNIWAVNTAQAIAIAQSPAGSPSTTTTTTATAEVTTSQE